MGKRRPSKSLKKIVLDASVLLKIVLPDKGELQIKQALKLFQLFAQGKTAIYLPVFWRFEIGNTLIRKLSDELFIQKFDFLLLQPFEEYIFNKLEYLTIGQFATSQQVSFYDASYHMLAIFTDSTFITADRKYFQKIQDKENIILLENLKF